jgi:hypothetical protein
VELAVNVAANSHRAVHGLHIALLNQNLFHLRRTARSLSAGARDAQQATPRTYSQSALSSSSSSASQRFT